MPPNPSEESLSHSFQGGTSPWAAKASDWARFWEKVDRSDDPDACWPWNAFCDKGGYGKFHAKNEKGKWRYFKAHGWLLGQLRGRPLITMPRGTEEGCHTCDNPPCCNPAHLYIGTRSRNMLDAVSRGRHVQAAKTHCPSGHEYAEANTYISPDGGRNCRACRTAEAQRKNKSDKEKRKNCKYGHPLSGDNLIICKGGRRKCRICEADRVAKSIAGRKAQLTDRQSQ